MRRQIGLVLLLCLGAGCGVVQGVQKIFEGDKPDAGFVEDAGTEVDAGKPPFCEGTPQFGVQPATCAPGEWCPMLDAREERSGDTWNRLSVVNDRDVWAIGSRLLPTRETQDVLSHWDGQQWTDVADLPRWAADAFWVGGPTDIWVLGLLPDTGLFHWDGTAFSSYPNPVVQRFNEIWGADSNNVWAVGNAGTILHWDGVSWNQQESGTGVQLKAIWGADANNIWVAGDSGTLLRWDGSRWAPQTLPDFVTFRYLSGTSATDVWASTGWDLYHFDGDQWTMVIRTRQMTQLWARGPNDVWGAEYEGGVRHWNGVEWSARRCGVQPKVMALHGSASGDVWIAGANGLLTHWNGRGGALPPAQVPNRNVGVIGGSGSNDVWLLEGTPTKDQWQDVSETKWNEFSDVFLRWDGQQWRQHRPPRTFHPSALWSIGPDDVWMLYGGNPIHWDGSTMKTFEGEERPPFVGARALWASGPNDVWIIGRGRIARWNGSSWSDTPAIAKYELFGIWGLSPTSIWAFASNEALHWDGTAWSNWKPALPDPSRGIDAIWGTSERDLWLYQNGRVHHWDGTAWTTLPQATFGGTTLTPRSVAMRGPTSIWLLGETTQMRNIVLRWDGAQWVTEAAGLGTAKWTALWSPSPDEVWAVGDLMNVYRLRRAP